MVCGSSGSKSKPTITLEGSYDGAEGSISFGPLRRPEAPSEKVPADILGLFDKPKFVTQETADQHPECLKYIHLEEEHTVSYHDELVLEVDSCVPNPQR